MKEIKDLDGNLLDVSDHDVEIGDILFMSVNGTHYMKITKDDTLMTICNKLECAVMDDSDKFFITRVE